MMTRALITVFLESLQDKGITFPCNGYAVLMCDGEECSERQPVTLTVNDHIAGELSFAMDRDVHWVVYSPLATHFGIGFDLPDGTQTEPYVTGALLSLAHAGNTVTLVRRESVQS